MHNIENTSDAGRNRDNGLPDTSTRDLAAEARDLLLGQDLVRGEPDHDDTAARLLDVLVLMHDDTGIDLDELPQVRAFAASVLGLPA